VLTFVTRRLLFALFSLIGISVLTFVLIRMIPGSAIDYRIGTSVGLTSQQVAILQHYFGLDVPVWKQYFIWISLVVHGDFGVSLLNGTPVLQLILSRIPITAELAFWALVIALLIGLPLGTLSALRPNTVPDVGARIFSLIGLSMPNFWLGTLLILLFSTKISWLPNGQSYATLTENPSLNLQQNVLPAIALGVSVAGSIMRMTRSAVLEVLTEDYVRTARAKGLPFNLVVMKHVLRNAVIPIITTVGVMAGYLLTGAVIIEQIFNIPGVGRLLLTSILGRDYPVVEGTVLVIALAFVLSNLLADVAYGFADPRITQT
jgi:peptide/nickel transport system permease protein